MVLHRLDSGKFVPILVSRETRDLVKRMANESGMRMWAVVEHAAFNEVFSDDK